MSVLIFLTQDMATNKPGYIKAYYYAHLNQLREYKKIWMRKWRKENPEKAKEMSMKQARKRKKI
jgi:hypothetical protein